MWWGDMVHGAAAAAETRVVQGQQVHRHRATVFPFAGGAGRSGHGGVGGAAHAPLRSCWRQRRQVNIGTPVVIPAGAGTEQDDDGVSGRGGLGRFGYGQGFGFGLGRGAGGGGGRG